MMTKEGRRQMLQDMAQRARHIAVFDGIPNAGGVEITNRDQRLQVEWRIGETAILNNAELVFRRLRAGRVTHAGFYTADGTLIRVIPLGKPVILNGGSDDLLRLKEGQLSIQLIEP